MTYDRRAAKNTYSDFLKRAEFDFLDGAAKVINGKQKYIKAKVDKGVSMSFLTFEGQDKSDFNLEGSVAVILQTNYDVLLTMQFTSAMTGRGQEERKVKVGELNQDFIVNLVLSRLG
jgi:hypothetical protein